MSGSVTRAAVMGYMRKFERRGRGGVRQSGLRVAPRCGDAILLLEENPDDPAQWFP